MYYALWCILYRECTQAQLMDQARRTAPNQPARRTVLTSLALTPQFPPHSSTQFSFSSSLTQRSSVLRRRRSRGDGCSSGSFTANPAHDARFGGLLRAFSTQDLAVVTLTARSTASSSDGSRSQSKRRPRPRVVAAISFLGVASDHLP